MKILIICPHFPPHFGGVAGHTYQLAKHLSRQDHQVHVLTDERHESSPTHDQDLAIHRIVKSWSILDVYNLLDSINEINPDRIIIQYLPFLYAKRAGLNLGIIGLTWLLKILKNRHISIFFHELYYPLQLNLKAILMFFGHLFMLFGVGLFAHNIFASTQRFASILKRFFFWKPHRIRWVAVGNTINFVKSTSNSQTDLKKQLKLAPDKRTYVCLGGLHASKLYPLLLEALEEIHRFRMQSFELLCIGPTKQDFERELGIRYTPNRFDFLRLTGPLKDDEVSHALQASDLYIGLYSDGLSTRRSAVLNAMAHNLPVLSTRSSHTEDIFLNLPGLMLLDLSAKDLKDRIIQLLLSLDLPQSECHTQEYFQSLFSWEHLVSKIENIQGFKS